jgi:hypothetical protein
MKTSMILLIASLCALIVGIILSLLYNGLFLFLFIPFGFGWGFSRKSRKEETEEKEQDEFQNGTERTS